MTNENRAEQISKSIKSWDRECVSELLGQLTELKKICSVEDLDIENYVDMTFLPSAEIPDDVDTAHPVWAMDINKNLLVGSDADETISLADFRAEM